MSLSDEELSSSEEQQAQHVAAKRSRVDTFGASSTTSFSSVPQESEDEQDKLSMTNDYNNTMRDVSKLDVNHKTPQPRQRRSSSTDQEDFDAIIQEPDEDEVSSRPTFGSMENHLYEEQNSSDPKAYSNMAQKMMKKMGYTPGKGLGKFEHGRTEPVEASTQKGRRGLGLKPSIVGEIPEEFQWTPDDDKPEIEEEVSWIPSSKGPLPDDVLEKWLKMGPKKMSIEDETEFVDPHILKGVLNAKTIFDTLSDEDLRNARARSNPYEALGGGIFLNRAAMKMANLDAIYGFMFTRPKRPDGQDAVGSKELLYFADICAGPGGFSEYVLYRRGWRAKGFGFTLRGNNDFKLGDFFAGGAETFNAYYGPAGDGDVYNPANVRALRDLVRRHTGGQGVHFVMADGGFSVEGQENLQEVLSHQLYLCQCAAALALLRVGGSFVVKLFDCFTPLTVGLIYIMYHCFENVSIHKCVTSRPANSERYMVCRHKRAGAAGAAGAGAAGAEAHLLRVCAALWDAPAGRGVIELVPLDVLKRDAVFFEYIYRSNCVIGEKQIRNLLKIAEYSKDRKLKEYLQGEVRLQCLYHWQIPDRLRTQPTFRGPDDTLAQILAAASAPAAAPDPLAFKASVLARPPELLASERDLKLFRNVYDWHFVFLSSTKGSPDLKFFLGCGTKQVYQLDGQRWTLVMGLNITLPARTLIYGEIVREYRGEGGQQLFRKALHVLDALALGGLPVAHLPLTERLNQCSLFCDALHAPCEPAWFPLRCKRACALERWAAAAAELTVRGMKRTRRAVTARAPPGPAAAADAHDAYYPVGSVLFLKEIREPWEARMSKSSGHKYYFGPGADGRPRSEYYIPEEARLDAAAAWAQRALWPWDAPLAVLDAPAPAPAPAPAGAPAPAPAAPAPAPAPAALHGLHLQHYIQQNIAQA